MNTRTKTIFWSLVALTTLNLPSSASASSHREALAILNNPCADNTDFYAWVNDSSHDTLTMIVVLNGLHEPGQGNQQTRLCDDTRYEVHIARGVDDLRPEMTYRVVLSSTPPTPVDETDLSLPPGGGKELLYQLGGVVQTYEVTKVEYGPNGRVQNETVLVSGVPVAPTNIGPRTDRIAYQLGRFDPTNPDHSTVGLYDDAFAAGFIHPMGTRGSEGRVFIGHRDDPFYLDEQAIFDVLNLRTVPPAGRPTSSGVDVFAGFNTNVIALEVPTKKVTGTDENPAHNGRPGNDTLLGLWTTVSQRKISIELKRPIQFRGKTTRTARFGPWVQVSRQGLPLINAGLIGVQDQEKYLRTTPSTDVENFAGYFLNPVIVRDLEFLGTYDELGVDQATIDSLKSNRVDILEAINLTNFPTPGAHAVPIAPGKTGDVLRLDVAIDSQFPNGRKIPGGERPNQEQVDVSDVLITLIASGGAIDLGDGVDGNDKNFLPEFPYVPLPHQGFGEGHNNP